MQWHIILLIIKTMPCRLLLRLITWIDISTVLTLIRNTLSKSAERSVLKMFLICQSVVSIPPWILDITPWENSPWLGTFEIYNTHKQHLKDPFTSPWLNWVQWWRCDWALIVHRLCGLFFTIFHS